MPFLWLFFFQAEDGIRDGTVTGVQTCALPIFDDGTNAISTGRTGDHEDRSDVARRASVRCRPRGPPASDRRGRKGSTRPRSEERRVGKGGRAGCAAGDESNEGARGAGGGASHI